MSMTRRNVLLGASGIVAATAVDAVTTRSDTPAVGGQEQSTATSPGEVRAFNGIYHGDS